MLPVGALTVVQSLVEPGQALTESLLWSLNTIWIFALGAGFRHERLLRERLAVAAQDSSRAALAEQRLRVAREVHDVLAHGLSVMIIQSEVADAFIDTDTDKARKAVSEIGAAGRSALSDTRQIVGLLREPGEHALAPAHTADDLPGLIGRMQAVGLPILVDSPAELPQLTNEVSATVYRVVQESLTNVLRHAGKVATQVRLEYKHGWLEVQIQSAGTTTQQPHRHGNGLTGMTERVTACGGELRCGPAAQGGFEVRALLPVPMPA
jgi:signal transduction histidine kinase